MILLGNIRDNKIMIYKVKTKVEMVDKAYKHLLMA